MRDPLYQDDRAETRLYADDRMRRMLMRMQWLKLATGLVALALVGAVWIVWRWG